MLDEAPLLSNEMMSLARWISEQTFCTYYEAVKAMLPVGINHKIIRSFCAVPGVDESIVASLDSDEKQVYDYLLSRSGYVKSENFLKTLGFDVSSDIPERLLKVGLLAAYDDAVRNIGDNNIRMVRLCEGSDDVSMTKKQSEVVNVLKDVGSAISRAIRRRSYLRSKRKALSNALTAKSFVASSADMPCKAHMTAARYISPMNSRKPMPVCSKITKAVRVRLHFFTALPEAAKHQFI